MEIDDADAVRQLGDWLARWRTAAGVSQRKLASLAGIDQGGLSRVERGLQGCGAKRLARLIFWLGKLADPPRPDTGGPRPVRRDRQPMD